MPQLPKELADQVDSTEESEGFKLVEAGIYTGRLSDVTVSENPGPSGYHQWLWKYDVVDEPGVTLINFLSLSPKAAFKFKETFDAFGVPAGTNTDELLGEIVSLRVSKAKATKGKNVGKDVNNIEEVMPALESAKAETANIGDF